MKRAVWILLVIAMATYGAADGCREPHGLIIEANALVSGRTQCQIPTGTSRPRPAGILDVAAQNEYVMYPQVRNALPESETATGLGEDDLRLENNGVTFLGAEISFDYNVFDANSPTFIENYQGSFFHASGYAAPGETVVLGIPVIGWAMGNELRGMELMRNLDGSPSLDIVVRMVVHGMLSDNTRITSNEFWFPITVCSGCLLVRSDEEEGDLTCRVGQDDGYDARLCEDFADPDFGTGLDPNNREHVVEARRIAQDRCMGWYIVNGVRPPKSDYYWQKYGHLYPDDPRN